MARLKLEEIPLLVKVLTCRSPLSFFTIMALEVLGASPALRTDLSYGPAELFLRRRVRGTVFQPDAFHSFPGLITARPCFKGRENNFADCLVPTSALLG